MKAFIYKYKKCERYYAECPICHKIKTLHPNLSDALMDNPDDMAKIRFFHNEGDHDQIVTEGLKRELIVYPNAQVLEMGWGSPVTRLASK